MFSYGPVGWVLGGLSISLLAQKTIIRYGTMTVDKFGWIFTYDGYRLGVNTNLKLIFHFGCNF